MAKIVFTAELSFDTDRATNFEEAFNLLQDGMSFWPPYWAPYVQVNIQKATIDGQEVKPSTVEKA